MHAIGLQFIGLTNCSTKIEFLGDGPVAQVGARVRKPPARWWPTRPSCHQPSPAARPAFAQALGDRFESCRFAQVMARDVAHDLCFVGSIYKIRLAFAATTQKP
jgi:hypothetical protein